MIDGSCLIVKYGTLGDVVDSSSTVSDETGAPGAVIGVHGEADHAAAVALTLAARAVDKLGESRVGR